MRTLKVSTRVLASVAAVCFVSLMVAGIGGSMSTGMDTAIAGQQDVDLGTGATCHSELPSPDVRAVLTGVPGNYTQPTTPGGTYAARDFWLNVSIEGGPEASESGAQGGFNLYASSGTLKAAPGFEEFIQITDIGEATHTADGNKMRNWTLIWTSPDAVGEPVRFRLTVNAVNGDGSTTGDEWNRHNVFSEGEFGAPVGGPAHFTHIEHLGVNWLAYWVGIASFVFLLVVLFVYYFVFRYSETAHATDHRARKDKK